MVWTKVEDPKVEVEVKLLRVPTADDDGTFEAVEFPVMEEDGVEDVKVED